MPCMSLEEAQSITAANIRRARRNAAKIDEYTVREIRRLFATGTARKSELARMYNLTPMAIHFIVTRQTWADVADEVK